MKMLCFDTTAKTAAVAIVEEGKVLAQAAITTGLTHSQTLMPLCDSLMRAAGITLDEIDLVAVSAGPGSFTGLRIGIGTVKGLCQGSKKRCVGVSTLEALAWNAAGSKMVICPVMDARCNQVYTALFQDDGERPHREWEDQAISIPQLERQLLERKAITLLVGDGAELVWAALKDRVPGLRLATPAIRLQNAASVGFAALEKLKTEEPLAPADLMPRYLRVPQAERERLGRGLGR